MKVTIGNYASYIRVQDKQPVTKTVELTPSIYLDYNKDGELTGIEILSELVPEYYSDYKKKINDILDNVNEKHGNVLKKLGEE